MNTKYIWLLVILLGFTACNEIDDVLADNNILPAEELPELTAGTADFSNYVALGASFTAGFTDGALFKASQENSFPNILSKEFIKIGGGVFNQPLLGENTGGILAGGAPTPFGYRLVFGGAPVPLDAFLASQGASAPPITSEAGNNIGSDFNNFGIPGAKSFHLVTPGYAAFNPYYTRIASGGTSTVLGDALAQSPTFFTLSEIGGNDILQYATSGGTGVDQTGNINPASYSINDITDPNVFAQAFSSMVTALTQNGAKGAVTTVPYITDLPHFTTVPHNPIPLDAATAGFLNSASAYGAYNGGLDATLAFLIANPGQLNFFFPPANGMTSQEIAEAEMARRKITFSEGGGNAVVIFDEYLTDLTLINTALVSMRQATAEDLLVLPSLSFIGTEAIPGNPSTVNGVAIPLADKWALTPEEQENIKTATDSYNITIKGITDANPDVALVDLNGILQEATISGIPFDGYTMTTSLVTGGAVSLDGIHLTARGYAFMANKFLEVIDADFGSNFIESGSVSKAGDYPTNYSPLLP